MKKVLLFLTLFLITCQSFASLRQTSYRWRNDDGSEASATWKAPDNTGITISDTGEVLRLRIQLDNANGSGSSSQIDGMLEYSADGGTTWTTINNGATNHFWYVNSANVSAGTPTSTDLLNSGAGFVAGSFISGFPTGGPWFLNDGAITEYEWAIRATGNVWPATTYLFRVINLEDGSLNDAELVTDCLTSYFAPHIVSTQDGQHCGAAAVEMSATAFPGNAVINWYTSASGGAPVATGSTYTTPLIGVTTTYYVSASIAGCGESERVPVQAEITAPTLTASLGPDRIFCDSEELSPGNGFESYLWSDGSTAPTLTVLSSGEYYVLATDEGGCTSSDTVQLEYHASPLVTLGPDEEICGDNNQSVTLDAQNAGSTYQWSTGATTQSIVITQSGTYSVTVTNEYGCVSSDTTTKVILLSPLVQLGNDTSICEGVDITLNAGDDGENYYWNTGSLNPTIVVDESGTYIVVVSAANGCTVTDTINVIVNGQLPSIDAILVESIGPYTFQFTAYNPQGAVGQYVWDFGDNTPVSNAISPIHTYAGPGNFEVKLLLNTEQCGALEYISSVHILGMDDLRIGDQLKLYPNPASSLLRIEMDGIYKMEQLQVINTLGQIMVDRKVSGLHSDQVDVSGLAAGVYSLLIKTDHGFVVRKFEVVR